MNGLAAILKSQRGYTMVELLSMLMIMGVLTTLVVYNSRSSDTHQQLRDAASDYVTAAKQAESMAASSQPVLNPATNKAESRKAYGVCLSSEGAAPCTVTAAPITKYEVYARRGDRCPDPNVPCNGWGDPDPAVIDLVKTYTLPRSTRFVPGGATTYVDYQPPAPSMEIHKYSGGPVENTAEIQLILAQDLGKQCTEPGVFCNTVAMRANAGVVYVK